MVLRAALIDFQARRVRNLKEPLVLEGPDGANRGDHPAFLRAEATSATGAYPVSTPKEFDLVVVAFPRLRKAEVGRPREPLVGMVTVNRLELTAGKKAEEISAEEGDEQPGDSRCAAVAILGRGQALPWDAEPLGAVDPGSHRSLLREGDGMEEAAIIQRSGRGRKNAS